MEIYKNRYQANKAKRDGEKVVKVCGGYAVMDYQQYAVWKNQK